MLKLYQRHPPPLPLPSPLSSLPSPLSSLPSLTTAQSEAWREGVGAKTMLALPRQ